MKDSRYISQPGFTDTGMIFKFVQKSNEFIHTFAEGELLYRLGFNREDIVGKTLHNFYWNDIETANLLNGYYKKAWEGQYIEYEGEFRGIYYVIYLRPLFYKEKVAEVVGTCVDITNKKIMEEFRPEMKKYYYNPAKYKTYLEQLGIQYPTIRK